MMDDSVLIKAGEDSRLLKVFHRVRIWDGPCCEVLSAQDEDTRRRYAVVKWPSGGKTTQVTGPCQALTGYSYEGSRIFVQIKQLEGGEAIGVLGNRFYLLSAERKVKYEVLALPIRRESSDSSELCFIRAEPHLWTPGHFALVQDVISGEKFRLLVHGPVTSPAAAKSSTVLADVASSVRGMVPCIADTVVTVKGVGTHVTIYRAEMVDSLRSLLEAAIRLRGYDSKKVEAEVCDLWRQGYSIVKATMEQEGVSVPYVDPGMFGVDESGKVVMLPSLAIRRVDDVPDKDLPKITAWAMTHPWLTTPSSAVFYTLVLMLDFLLVRARNDEDVALIDILAAEGNEVYEKSGGDLFRYREKTLLSPCPYSGKMQDAVQEMSRVDKDTGRLCSLKDGELALAMVMEPLTA